MPTFYTAACRKADQWHLYQAPLQLLHNQYVSAMIPPSAKIKSRKAIKPIAIAKKTSFFIFVLFSSWQQSNPLEAYILKKEYSPVSKSNFLN